MPKALLFNKMGRWVKAKCQCAEAQSAGPRCAAPARRRLGTARSV